MPPSSASARPTTCAARSAAPSTGCSRRRRRDRRRRASRRGDIDGMIPPPGYTTARGARGRTSASRTCASRRRCTWAARARPPRSATPRWRSSRASARHVLVSVGWNGYSAFRPKPASRRPQARLDRQRVERHRARLLPAVRRGDRRRRCTRGSRRATSCSYGVPDDAPGAVAVAFRKHAQLNARALMRGKPLTMDDYLASRWMSRAVPALRLLPRDRRRRARSWSARRARARPAAAPPVAILGARRGSPVPGRRHPEPARPLPHRSHRRPRRARSRWRASAPHDVDFLADLRLLHLRRAAAARGARALRPRRGGGVRARRPHRARRRRCP